MINMIKLRPKFIEPQQLTKWMSLTMYVSFLKTNSCKSGSLYSLLCAFFTACSKSIVSYSLSSLYMVILSALSSFSYFFLLNDFSPLYSSFLLYVAGCEAMRKRAWFEAVPLYDFAYLSWILLSLDSSKLFMCENWEEASLRWFDDSGTKSWGPPYSLVVFEPLYRFFIALAYLELAAL